jgi:biopolymer transport protein ExbD
MNFRRGALREEPEMNLVPLIDVLLVTIIFLVVTTTYSKYSELQINLPTAEANKPLDRPEEINIAISAKGQYVVNRTPVSGEPATLAAELKRAAGKTADPMIIINADAGADFQKVVNAMEAARLAGYGRITFTTQQGR